MVKRYFKGTKKCGFCGRELTMDEICEWIPYGGKRDGDIDEEQCPHCGYHSSLIEDPYQETATDRLSLLYIKRK